MKIVEIETRQKNKEYGPLKTVGKGFDDYLQRHRNKEDYIQRLRHTESELLTSLFNTIRLHRIEVEKSKTVFGRFIGLFTPPVDPEFVRIDGMRLLQCFEFTNTQPDCEIHISKEYNVEVHQLKLMFAQIEKRQVSQT